MRGASADSARRPRWCGVIQVALESAVPDASIASAAREAMLDTSDRMGLGGSCKNLIRLTESAYGVIVRRCFMLESKCATGCMARV